MRPAPISCPSRPGPPLSLTLNHRELKLLRAALAALSSPLGATDLDRWRGDVNRIVRSLFQADQVAFFLAGCEGAPFQSNEYDENDLQPYLEYYREIDQGLERVKRSGLTVLCRRQLFDGDLDVLLESECYNDFLAPAGMEDSVGIVAEPTAEAFTGLWVHNRKFGHPNAGERGLEILSLLYPVFKAGVAMAERFYGARKALGSMLDGIEEATALFGPDGNTLHVNVALERMLAETPARSGIEGRMGLAARAATGLAGLDHPEASADASQSFRAAGHLFEIRAIRLGQSLGLPHGSSIVVLQRSRVAPRPRWLQETFGLTKRQAQVAVLLWQKMSNQEIADELYISPHTARHHTEMVLAKLDIHSRDDVRKAVAAARRA